MSKLLYDFLADSPLFTQVETLWDGYSDADLRSELSAYRKHAQDAFPHIVAECESRRGIFTFAGFQMPRLSLLRQLALYLDAMFVYDPLFAFRDQQDQYSHSVNRMLGYESSSTLDRERLQQAARYMKHLTPFVAGEYVAFFPFDLSPDFTKGVPIYVSENYFDELLSDDLRKWFMSRALVRSLQKTERGWIQLDELHPCRAISIDFSHEDDTRTRIYHLFEQEIIDFDRETGKASFRMTFPSESPTQAYFEAWVKQSVNRAAHDIYSTVFFENVVAARLSGAMYLTPSDLVRDLLRQSFPPKEGVPDMAANCMLQMNLPVLQEIPLDDLMRIRANETPAFQTFRSYLERRVSEIRLETDPERIRQRLDSLEYEIRETNIRELETAIHNVRRLLKIDMALIAGTLIATILTGGWGIVTSAVAAVQGMRTYDEYRRGVKANPSFLYWKMAKRSASTDEPARLDTRGP